VATSRERARETVAHLRREYGIEARGHEGVAEALRVESPDLVAICSPIEQHRDHLRIAARAAVHCLCEKPMWWGTARDRAAETAALVDAFLERRRLVTLVTQWPFTLPAFRELHPDAGEAPPSSFEMFLAPSTTGNRMILDSVSHPLSLLHRLCGCGAVENAAARFEGDSQEGVRLDFVYRHESGRVRCVCRLDRHPSAPRPAWYSIDARRVDREIDPTRYEIYFRANGRRVRVADPLELLVEDFLRRVESEEPPERRALIESVTNLETLHRAGERAGGA
jgi:predicted dehydrogenase